MARFVNVRIPAEIDEALRHYVPTHLEGATAASARVRYALLRFLHERDSCVDLPLEARPNVKLETDRRIP